LFSKADTCSQMRLPVLNQLLATLNGISFLSL